MAGNPGCVLFHEGTRAKSHHDTPHSTSINLHTNADVSIQTTSRGKHRGVRLMPILLPPSFSFISDEYSLVGTPRARARARESERERGRKKNPHYSS